MNILGIDAGQVRMGFASVEFKKDKTSLNHVGVLYHPRDASFTFNEYLNDGIYKICDEFPSLLHITKPDLIIAELVPVGRLGSNTELNVAAITTCKVIAWQWGIDWKDVAASTAKKHVTGNGRATKKEVKEEMINRFPKLKIQSDKFKEQQKIEGLKAEGFPQDLYDAVAIALTGVELYGKANGTEETQEPAREES